MDLYLNDYPSRLTCEEGMFSIKNEQEEKSISPKKIRSICLTRACMVSTDAMLLAVKHEIPIVLLNGSGKPKGRMWSQDYGSIATIRRKQIAFSTSGKAENWLLARLREKAHREKLLLESIADRNKKKRKKIASAVANIEIQQERLGDLMEKKETDMPKLIRGIEGSIARDYFQALSQLLPKDYRFTKRSRRPAKDIFNAILNYCYGILYNQINTALLSAGLDPYLAVFHQERNKRPALSFDFIEKYRPWAEWVSARLCMDQKIKTTHTRAIKGGIWLNEEGRKIVIEGFQGFMDEKVLSEKRKLKRKNHIKQEAYQMAQSLLKNQL